MSSAAAVDHPDLQALATKFKNCVDVKDRQYRLRIYKQCFVGSEAVTFLVNNGIAESREEAVKLGNELMKNAGDPTSDYHLFEHVAGDHDFVDEYYFYRFLQPGEISTNITKSLRKSGGGIFGSGSKGSDGAAVSSSGRRMTRPSMALGEVKIVREDHIQLVNPDNMEPVRILVTLHHMEQYGRNAYEKGLGYWVYYVFSKYLKLRNIPYVMSLKSIVISGKGQTTIDTVKEYIKTNKVDIVIPTDTTDTMFLSRHIDEIKSTGVHIAVTPNVEIYEMLEDKWRTYNFAVDNNIPTPTTELFSESKFRDQFPYFLKVASGTNAGRGVELVKNQEELDEAVNEFTKNDKDALLLCQQPVFGRVIQGQFNYYHGKCIAFFFSELNDAEDLAAGATKFIFTKDTGDACSAKKVVLEDDQWESVTQIAVRVGEVTKYHGFMDIEFLVPGEEARAKGVDAFGKPVSPAYLLECNPRFSGDIHTTLSNPGFLDNYFDIVYDRIDPDQMPTVFSHDVEITTRYKDFDPAGFYLRHPLQVVSNRAWNIPAEMRFKGRPIVGAESVKEHKPNAITIGKLIEEVEDESVDI